MTLEVSLQVPQTIYQPCSEDGQPTCRPTVCLIPREARQSHIKWCNNIQYRTTISYIPIPLVFPLPENKTKYYTKVNSTLSNKFYHPASGIRHPSSPSPQILPLLIPLPRTSSFASSPPSTYATTSSRQSSHKSRRSQRRESRPNPHGHSCERLGYLCGCRLRRLHRGGRTGVGTNFVAFSSSTSTSGESSMRLKHQFSRRKMDSMMAVPLS